MADLEKLITGLEDASGEALEAVNALNDEETSENKKAARKALQKLRKEVQGIRRQVDRTPVKSSVEDVEEEEKDVEEEEEEEKEVEEGEEEEVEEEEKPKAVMKPKKKSK